MRICTPLLDVKDQLISYIAEGYSILGWAFNNHQDTGVQDLYQGWANRVANYLKETFPTAKEFGQFQYKPEPALAYPPLHVQVQQVVNAMDRQVRILEGILETLEMYYQFEPDSLRVFIQNVDSFD